MIECNLCFHTQFPIKNHFCGLLCLNIMDDMWLPVCVLSFKWIYIYYYLSALSYSRNICLATCVTIALWLLDVCFEIYQWHMQRISRSTMANLTRAHRARSVRVRWANVTLASPMIPPCVVFFTIFFFCHRRSQNDKAREVWGRGLIWSAQDSKVLFLIIRSCFEHYFAVFMSAIWNITSVTFAHLTRTIPT